MSAASIVTVALVVLAVLAVALFLLRIGVMLREISQKLHSVIGSVAAIPEKTAPIAPVLGSINADLKTARDVLEGLLAKLGPVAQPDRIIDQRAIERTERRERRPDSDGPSTPAPAPAPAPPSPVVEAQPKRIVYRHETPPSSTPAEPPTPAPPPDRDDVIHYRRGFQQ